MLTPFPFLLLSLQGEIEDSDVLESMTPSCLDVKAGKNKKEEIKS
jgi:hypothetical protein